MDDDRPHLGPGLLLAAAGQALAPPRAILRLLVRYRKVDTIERGIAVTHDVLRATVELARAHGARPAIIVPQFAPEQAGERGLRQRIFDGVELPVVRVELDGGWRIPGDGHPDARAARAIAAEVVARLRDR